MHLLNAEPDQGSRKSHFHEVFEQFPKEKKRRRHEKGNPHACAVFACHFCCPMHATLVIPALVASKTDPDCFRQ